MRFGARSCAKAVMSLCRDAAAPVFGVTNSNAESQRQDIEQGDRVLVRTIDIVGARDEREIATAFEMLVQRRTAALLIASDLFFFSRCEQIMALADGVTPDAPV